MLFRSVSANTGPVPGVPVPRGAWKKTRPLDDHFLFAIRPPYVDDSPSKSRMTEVKIVAAYYSLDTGQVELLKGGDEPK